MTPDMVSQGTGIKFFGTLSKGGGLVLQLDQKITTVLLNNTTNGPADGTIPAFESEKLEDGDHQLFGRVESREDNGLIIVDHFEFVTPYFVRSEDSALTTSPLPGLRIRPEGASTFSGLVQMRRTYPKKQRLWMIPSRTLSLATPPNGFITLQILGATHRAWRTQKRLAHR